MINYRSRSLHVLVYDACLHLNPKLGFAAYDAWTCVYMVHYIMAKHAYIRVHTHTYTHRHTERKKDKRQSRLKATCSLLLYTQPQEPILSLHAGIILLGIREIGRCTRSFGEASTGTIGTSSTWLLSSKRWESRASTGHMRTRMHDQVVRPLH